MTPADDSLSPTPELLEQWALGRLEPAEAAALEARASHSPELQEALDAAARGCAAMRAALHAGHAEETDEIGDDTLAAYLDDALDAATREALEAALAKRPGLLARLAALRDELSLVMNLSADVNVVEKFLAGETLSFERPDDTASQAKPMTYEAISEADEARKKRYLQSGN